MDIGNEKIEIEVSDEAAEAFFRALERKEEESVDRGIMSSFLSMVDYLGELISAIQALREASEAFIEFMEQYKSEKK